MSKKIYVFLKLVSQNVYNKIQFQNFEVIRRIKIIFRIFYKRNQYENYIRKSTLSLYL